MRSTVHLPLTLFAVLVYLFLMGPLVIVIGAALSDSSYLTFPPQGLTLRWFEKIFEMAASSRWPPFGAPS